MPGFGLEVSWSGSAFWGEIFSRPHRETFFSCPNSEKLQGRLFFVFHREGGGVFGAGQNKERVARAIWEFPVSQCRPLSLQFPSLEVGGGGFIRIFFYAI